MCLWYKIRCKKPILYFIHNVYPESISSLVTFFILLSTIMLRKDLTQCIVVGIFESFQ